MALCSPQIGVCSVIDFSLLLNFGYVTPMQFMTA